MRYIKTLKQYKESVDFEPEFDELEDEFDVDFQEEEELVGEEPILDEEPIVGEEPIDPLDMEGENIIDTVSEPEEELDIDGDGVVDVVPSELADEYTDFAQWEEPNTDVDPDFVEDDPIGDVDLDLDELPGEIEPVGLEEEPIDGDLGLGDELEEIGDPEFDEEVTDSLCDFCDEQPKTHGGLCDACYDELED